MPRYVYENLCESTDYLSEKGRIIGYRISSELVIHSVVLPNFKFCSLSAFIRRYGGKLLSFPEAVLLLDNYFAVADKIRRYAI